MYIVTFTAHQQRNIVWTPHFVWAGDTTDRIEGKGRFSVVCGIERKTVSSWFE